VLENTAGRSLDGALACALATLLLLIPANAMVVMTVHFAGFTRSTYLGSGLLTAWDQGWPLLAIVLGLQGYVLPLIRFSLLSVTLGAIRLGRRDAWLGPAFRYCEKLDLWAMPDVLLIGAGVGYGRIASQIPVHIDAGGWCFIGAALMTMVTRASLERRAVWRRLEMAPSRIDTNAVACTSCDLVLPRTAEGQRCSRCGAPVHRRHPFAMMQCAALVLACWALMPIAYAFPMSALWEAGVPHPHTIINGIQLLYEHGFWPFAILIFLVSVAVPFTKLIGLTWFLISIHRGSDARLRQKTRLYRAIDELGRWSNLDPFTVVIFAPMITLGQVAHIDFMGGALAFLTTVVLSMIAARVFDPRLLWDAAAREHGDTVGALQAARV
jgi:paraquat-inducible protein A